MAGDEWCTVYGVGVSPSTLPWECLIFRGFEIVEIIIVQEEEADNKVKMETGVSGFRHRSISKLEALALLRDFRFGRIGDAGL